MLLETEMRACYTFWEEKERATSLQIAALLSEDWVVPSGHSLLQVTTNPCMLLASYTEGGATWKHVPTGFIATTEC